MRGDHRAGFLDQPSSLKLVYNAFCFLRKGRLLAKPRINSWINANKRLRLAQLRAPDTVPGISERDFESRVGEILARTHCLFPFFSALGLVNVTVRAELVRSWLELTVVFLSSVPWVL